MMNTKGLHAPNVDLSMKSTGIMALLEAFQLFPSVGLSRLFCAVLFFDREFDNWNETKTRHSITSLAC